MLFQRETKRLLGVLLMLFATLALSAAYWVVDGAATLLGRPDNPRLLEAAAAVQRGSIYDRNGHVLVSSSPARSGVGAPMQRQYHVPAAYSVLGYYSLRYGASGVELAFDSHLTGSDRPITIAEALEGELLHHRPAGGDIMLTLDADIQQRLAERLRGFAGAGVVIDVPSGDILAAVSLPTYDPNTLDTDWDQLVSQSGDPFFNRVVQGRYQPGSALQTPLMAAASLIEFPADRRFESSTLPFELAGISRDGGTAQNVVLECAVRLPERALTLQEAYIYACPSPFAAFAEEIGDTVITAMMETFHVEDTPSLPGFPTAIVEPPAAESAPFAADSSIIADALGQGDIVVSPLMMAVISAGIVNDGNAPPPALLYAMRTRSDDSDGSWERLVQTTPTFPIATISTARLLQDYMREAVINGAAQNAGRPGIDVGGHAALAHAGDETHAWFIGFTTLQNGRGVAIAIVIEDNADPGLAADIGGDVLQTAHDRQSS
ncbi:MAG: hypothetical protein JNL42_04665 [Anaerolineae bacterium]|nr:hypothetical protein [Anaerolineae bacterium]